MASSSSFTMKMIENTKIKQFPEPPNSSIESTLQLTWFDICWLKIPPVERLFFYKLDDTATPASFTSQIIPKLKQSLSLTLHHYLPITGNLKWSSNPPGPINSYTPNNGISFTVAESDADFDRLSSNGVYGAVELHPLVPQLESSDDSASIVAFQITLFPHKGFSIGITAHHGVLDGKTTTMFMKSWAYMCNKGNIEKNPPLPSELTPVFDRDIIKVPTGFDLDMLYNQSLNFIGKSLKISTDKGAAPNLVRATVKLTQDDIKKLRERVLSKASDGSKNLHLSAFALTFGYVSSCIIKATGGEGDRTVCLGFTADCRTRLDPPVSENYFGNCNTGLSDLSKAKDLMDSEQGFVFAVEKVGNMVKGLTEKGVFEGADDRWQPVAEMMKEPEGSVQMVRVAGSPRFDLYETDFGWGRPWKVVVVSIGNGGAVSMAESRDGDRGIEVGLALNKHAMDRFLSMFLNDV